jgi:hypothetical protein
MIKGVLNLNNEQKQFLDKLIVSGEELTKSWVEYWLKHSFIDTWQFWFNVILLISPLIFLFFMIDRKKAFHIGFFGFNVHVWFTYIDTFGARLGLWSYPYQTIPLLSANFGLDVSFMPVFYMLLYQYTYNYKKNYYLYAFGASIIITYTLKPIFLALNLLELHKGLNYIHLVIALIPVILVSKWITNLFLYFERNHGKRV